LGLQRAINWFQLGYNLAALVLGLCICVGVAYLLLTFVFEGLPLGASSYEGRLFMIFGGWFFLVDILWGVYVSNRKQVSRKVVLRYLFAYGVPIIACIASLVYRVLAVKLDAWVGFMLFTTAFLVLYVAMHICRYWGPLKGAE
jgi:hypothetical protein